MKRFAYCFLALVALALPAQADPAAKARAAFAFEAGTPTAVAAADTWDVLDILNAQRAARGLTPYIWDRELTIAAGSAAEWRAARLLFGHTPNDFAHLPRGATADAAGCAAYPAEHGFMACACYEPGEHYAGAAWTRGADGKQYCHLFIRRVGAVTTIRLTDCPSGSWGTVTRSQFAGRGRRR